MNGDTPVCVFVFNCHHCNSQKSVGYGIRKTKTWIKSKRKCKDCGRVYTNQPMRINNKKNTEANISLALDILKSHSLRDTKRILRQKYGINISHASISNWKKEYCLPPEKKVVFKETSTKKTESQEDDWMYKPLLNTNTRTDYDGNKIDADWDI